MCMWVGAAARNPKPVSASWKRCPAMSCQRFWNIWPGIIRRSGKAGAKRRKAKGARRKSPHQPSSRLLKNPPFTLRQAQGERREACNRWRFSVRAEPVEARIRLFQQPARDPLCLRRRGRSLYMLNRASRDWHTRIVTLNGVKGLAVRFFAALRMTVLRNSRVKCTNVLNSDLAAESPYPVLYLCLLSLSLSLSLSRRTYPVKIGWIGFHIE